MPTLKTELHDEPPLPDLSLILINWRMRKDLEACLHCIEQHQHACRVETILVNKPSDDGTEALIAERFPTVRLFSHPEFGFATMRNVGIRNARGRYCLVLDTDIDLLPGCFDAMVAFMDRHPELGGCGGHTTRLNGEIEYNVKRFYDLPTIVVRRTPIGKWWPTNPWDHRHLMKDKDHARAFLGDWMAGACFCMRREAIEDAGLFDESMHYFEDVDWCWRVKRAGWKIGFNPHSRIIHKVQSLSKKGGLNALAIKHLMSGLRFWWKVRHEGLNWAWPRRPIPRRQEDARPVSEATPARESATDLSVIVVNYNGEGLLRDCLQSLRAAAPAHRLQVIVVDNASADGSVAMARREFPEALVLANSENLGFTKANNQGIERATGRHVMLLNNDTVVRPGAFDVAIRLMDRHPRIGAAGLRLLNADGSLQYSCRRFPSFAQALFNRYSLLTRLFPNNRFSRAYLMKDVGHRRMQDVDWVSGACLMIRREVLDQIGGLDERFFMYSEDVDFCYRVWQAGYRVTYLPQARVVHLIGQSSRRKKLMTIRERHLSMYRFYKKHYSRNLMLLDVLTAVVVAFRFATQAGAAAAGMALDRVLGRTTA